MYQYILFDLDGTLTDPKVGITSCVQYSLHKMGIEEPDLDKLEPFIGPPLLDSYREYYGLNEEEARQAIEFYRNGSVSRGCLKTKCIREFPSSCRNCRRMGESWRSHRASQRCM